MAAKYYVEARFINGLWEVEHASTSKAWAVTVAASAAKAMLQPYRIRYCGKVIARWRDGKRVK